LWRLFGLERNSTTALVVGEFAIAIELQRSRRTIVLDEDECLGLEIDTVDGKELVDRWLFGHLLGSAEQWIAEVVALVDLVHWWIDCRDQLFVGNVTIATWALGFASRRTSGTGTGAQAGHR
jgi:hypothetical protein